MPIIRHSSRFASSAAALTLLCSALAVGCSGTRVISGGPFTGAVTTQEGTLRYSLSKSVVTVEAVVTRGASGQVTFDGNDFTVDTRLVRKDARAAVTISTVADEDQFFTLRLEHGNSADDSLSVDIAPNGVLRSIGVTSTSQLGNTVKNVATIAASIAASVAASALSGDPRRQAASLVCEKLADEAGTPGRCPLAAAPTPPTAPKPATTPPTRTKAGATPTPAPAPATPPAPTCDARTEQTLADLSMANLYFLARSPKHRRIFRDLRAAETRLTETTCRRIDLERQLGAAPTRDIADLTARIAVQVQLEASARADLRAVSEELDSAVRGFQIATGIDGPATTETVRITFDLDEIPPPDILRRAASPEPPARTSGMTDTEVRTALRSFPRMLELYDRTGIALTITPPPYIARGGTLWEAATHDTPKTHIYYRPAYTATIATFATTRTLDEQGGQSELLRFFATATDEVIHPKMPVQGFAFSPTDFGERKISLGFDDRGRLIRFEQSGKSSVVGATAAVADAVQTARDEYATTLARIAEIQDTQQKLQQSDVITEIDRLRKQRELLDARLELAGTRGSYDLLLERKRIDAELAAIQGRRALADERDATSLGQEVGELRTRLDQLARDLEEIKHRSEQSPPVRGR